MHNRRNTRHARVTAAALAVLAGAVAAPSAQAAADESAESGARHCVSEATTGQQSCYGTFTEAVSAASGGRITDAPASAGDAARDSGFRAETRQFNTSAGAMADGGVIQGTFFDDPGFGGDSLTVTGESLCKKDGVVNYQHDLEDGWKNRVSSVQPWGGCWIWLYPEPGLGGDRDGPFKENASDIGSMMNDRTQSIGFS